MDDAEKEFNDTWAQIEPIVFDQIKQMFPHNRELVDNLIIIAEFAKRVQLTVDEATRKLALDFLREAERDIQSCSLLYSKKIYPHAVYHFQQAVEKATKGYVLGFGLLSMEEVKTHDTPELFLKVTLKKTGLNSWANQSDDNDLKALIRKSQHVIADRALRQQVARMSYDSITAYLSQIASYRNLSERMVPSLIEKVYSTMGKDVPPPPLLQAMSVMVALFILAAISFPHEGYTRYPDGDITPSEYIVSLAVVRAIPKMIKCLTPQIQELKTTLPQ